MAKRSHGSCGVLFALALGAAAGCGYGFAGVGSRIPAEVRTVSLGPIQNLTREINLDKRIVEAMEDEMVARGRLKVVPVGQGDASLTGVIRGYNSRPISFSGRDEALQYELSIVVDMQLQRRADGKILWRTRNLVEVQDYSAVPGVVVTGSSAFQQSTVNAADLPRFTDIQLSEGQRREATDKLLETLARDAYNQMMEDF